MERTPIRPFKIKDVKIYSSIRFPSFQEPKEIGHFSLNKDEIIFNDSNLKFFQNSIISKRRNLDLKIGQDIAIRKPALHEAKLDNMLKWILKNKQYFIDRNLLNKKPNFICYRGLLTTLLCTPYENQNGWILVATQCQGIIFLCMFKTPEDKQSILNRTVRNDSMCYWGYKFENYLLSTSPTLPPDTSEPVNEFEEYNVMVESKLNDKRLIFGAEVDGVDVRHINAFPPSSLKKYVELKTSQVIQTHHQNKNFYRYKSIKWWAQSFLIGIPKIICGFRSNDGIVDNIVTYKTQELPKMSEICWSASACVNFCDNLLDYVQEVVNQNDPSLVYKFTWNLNGNITCQCVPHWKEYEILPNWFISEFTL